MWSRIESIHQRIFGECDASRVHDNSTRRRCRRNSTGGPNTTINRSKRSTQHQYALITHARISDRVCKRKITCCTQRRRRRRRSTQNPNRDREHTQQSGPRDVPRRRSRLRLTSSVGVTPSIGAVVVSSQSANPTRASLTSCTYVIRDVFSRFAIDVLTQHTLKTERGPHDISIAEHQFRFTRCIRFIRTNKPNHHSCLPMV